MKCIGFNFKTSCAYYLWFQVCLWCQDKSHGGKYLEADIPLILKYLDKDFESHKEYLPTGLCKGCRTRLVPARTQTQLCLSSVKQTIPFNSWELSKNLSTFTWWHVLVFCGVSWLISGASYNESLVDFIKNSSRLEKYSEIHHSLSTFFTKEGARYSYL